MATGSIRYPDDASNTGPREATRTFTEDSVTKHLPRVELADNRTRSGVYFVHSGVQTVQASAHGAGAGFFWIVNHVGATTELFIRRLRFTSQHSAAFVSTSAPMIAMETFTFTGTPSGAQLTAAKARSSYGTPSTWSVRTANTGMTQTAGAIVCGFIPVMAMTAVGAAAPSVDEYAPGSVGLEHIMLDAGEGIRCYQNVAGTASDSRKFVIDMTIEEVTEF